MTNSRHSGSNRHSALPEYAELHCLSSYSFLKGASHPDELVETAARLNYQALAITDECSVSGIVRAHVAARAQTPPLKLVIGSEIILEDGPRLVILARNREGYAQLCQLITLGRRGAKKGQYSLTRRQIESIDLDHCLLLWIPPPLGFEASGAVQEESVQALREELCWLQTVLNCPWWLLIELQLEQFMLQRLGYYQKLCQQYRIKACAAGGVIMHHPERRVIHDVQTAILNKTVLSALDCAQRINAQGFLRPLDQLSRLYPSELLSETVHIANLCEFSLDELRYEYPDELVPEQWTAIRWLTHLVRQGMQRRWPNLAKNNIPQKVEQMVAHELALIEELKYEPYFLTVYDIVRFARSRGILCQGRGSAANSAVCYCLGITEVDPSRMSLLFERFVSKERNEPPDIDVDFEHERREEVIQYIYQKYGRHRAAIAATIICYQPRSAIRDVGKALGFSLDQVNRLASSWQWWDGKELIFDESQTGMEQNSRAMRQLKKLVSILIGFPRHLSQHVGGFVIAADDLSRLVPVENAAMEDRTVIQWEKDDLESLGLLKIDVLALGMLSAIRKMLVSIGQRKGRPFTLSDIPPEDPQVYQMIQRADTLGVFQIESRAQMSMLPRLRPENYYDLVVQVAIVRPGPIQGDMVHPYLARRQGTEQVTYPSTAVREVLERTLGVPIFQEQVMQLAMVAAGFTAGEADQLRRSMAAWKKRGGLEKFEHKLREGMLARGYSEQFALQIFRQIRGFGDYGFPESHAASFALLAYVSAWLKHYYPAEFCAGLLNSQPMGFYAPPQLVNDARRHGVKVNPVDVNKSNADCTLEQICKPNRSRQSPPSAKPENPAGPSELRLGLRLVKGLSAQAMQSIVDCRPDSGYKTVKQLVALSGINKKDLESLAAADALRSLAGHRHKAMWQALGLETPLALFADQEKRGLSVKEVENSPAVMLPVPTEGEQIVQDYATTSLSLRRHPLELLRHRLEAKRICMAADLALIEHGKPAVTAGLVINRQRPSTSRGVIFMTLEDETGYSNIIVWPAFAEAQRKVLLHSRLLAVHGTVQNKQGVVYVVAGRLEDLTPWLGDLPTRSRDFH